MTQWRKKSGQKIWTGSLRKRQTGCSEEQMGTAVRDDFSCAIPSVAWTVDTCEWQWHSHMLLRERRLVNCHNHFREHLTTLVEWKMLRFCGPASLFLWTCLENCFMCALKSRMIITPAFIRVKEKTGYDLSAAWMGLSTSNMPYLCDGSLKGINLKELTYKI